MAKLCSFWVMNISSLTRFGCLTEWFEGCVPILSDLCVCVCSCFAHVDTIVATPPKKVEMQNPTQTVVNYFSMSISSF